MIVGQPAILSIKLFRITKTPSPPRQLGCVSRLDKDDPDASRNGNLYGPLDPQEDVHQSLERALEKQGNLTQNRVTN